MGYRNQCVHHFVSESIISIAMISLFTPGHRNGGNIDFHDEVVRKNDAMQRAQFLSHLLKTEFMYKPVTTFIDNFDETLDFMIDSQNILSCEWMDDANVIKVNEGKEDVMLFLAMLVW